jgi:hypothetical protein
MMNYMINIKLINNLIAYFLDNQTFNKDNSHYSPGYPYGDPNYLLSCARSVNSC